MITDETAEVPPAEECLRVLVVEDDEASREALAGLLRCCRHAVYTANDGAEALEVAARYQPQIVITDVCMPRMSGVELSQRLRQDLTLPPHAILALTALATDTWLDPAPASFDEVYAKPVDFDALATRLDAYAKLIRSWR